MESKIICGVNLNCGSTCASNLSSRGVLKARNLPATSSADFLGQWSHRGGGGPGSREAHMATDTEGEEGGRTDKMPVTYVTKKTRLFFLCCLVLLRLSLSLSSSSRCLLAVAAGKRTPRERRGGRERSAHSHCHCTVVLGRALSTVVNSRVGSSQIKIGTESSRAESATFYYKMEKP